MAPVRSSSGEAGGPSLALTAGSDGSGCMKRSKFVPFGVLFGVAVAVACSKSGSKNLGFAPHGDSGLSPAKMGQILNAAQQVTDTVPQAELVAQGKQLFES